MSVQVSALARADIDTASEDLADRFGETTADTFQQRLWATFRRLEAFPESAAEVEPSYPDHPGMRAAPVTRFAYRVVYYQPTPTGIRVVRVLHAAQDATAVFG